MTKHPKRSRDLNQWAKQMVDIATGLATEPGVDAPVKNAAAVEGRGRPKATGRGEAVIVRLHPPLLTNLDAWIARQDGGPSRPEAIRRLVERALAAAPVPPLSRTKGAPKAAEMAGREIDRIGDKSATDDERASRKRRLIKGPKEFRDMRGRR